jgi:two-component system cell cycle response regulator
MGETWNNTFDTNDSGLGPGGNVATQGLSATTPCRVLVVDDDPLVRTHISEALNAAQYQVESAATAEEALRIMDAAHCDIVLTDWQMPDMDGLELCRQVRLRIEEGYVYVLMLTIRATKQDEVIALAAGADDYVVKGTPTEEILARLEIGRRASRGGHTRQSQHSVAWGLSYKDPVTGAHSLEYLMHHLPRELSRSQRYGHALAILNCRIDGFTRFADRFGHAAADELLRSFVSTAETSIRTSDWLARTAGDSILIVLPETTAAGAQRAAQKVRALFAVHPFSTPAEPIGFTVSVEVTAVNGKHDADGTLQIDALLRAAKCETKSNPLPSDMQPTTCDTFAGEDPPGDGRHGLN